MLELFNPSHCFVNAVVRHLGALMTYAYFPFPTRPFPDPSSITLLSQSLFAASENARSVRPNSN